MRATDIKWPRNLRESMRTFRHKGLCSMHRVVAKVRGLHLGVGYTFMNGLQTASLIYVQPAKNSCQGDYCYCRHTGSPSPPQTTVTLFIYSVFSTNCQSFTSKTCCEIQITTFYFRPTTTNKQTCKKGLHRNFMIRTIWFSTNVDHK